MAPKPFKNNDDNDDDMNNHHGVAARPRAEYIANDPASLLDERIAQKRNDLTNSSHHNSKKKLAGESSIINNTPVMIDDTDGDRKPAAKAGSRSCSTNNSNMSSLHQSDMEAKRRARASSASSLVSESTTARSPPSSISKMKTQEEQDRQAKERARPRTTVFGAAVADGTSKNDHDSNSGKSLAELDRDVEAKMKGHRPSAASVKKKAAPAKVTTPTLLSESNRTVAAADTDAKNRARGSSKPTMIPGVVFEHNASSNNTTSGAGANKDIHFGGRIKATAAEKQQTADHLAKQSASAGPRYIGHVPNNTYTTASKKLDANIAGGTQGAFTSKHQEQFLQEHCNLHDKMVGGSPRHPSGFTEFGAMGLNAPNILDAGFNDLEDNNLAVAMPVEETDHDEDDAFRPHAVELDPDSKPGAKIPLRGTRRFRLYGCLAFLLLIVVIVAVVVSTTVMKNAATLDVPSSAPTTTREGMGIQEQLEKFVGIAKLDDTNSPYFKALDWILHEDEMQLTPEAENLLQRYFLVMFYFSTSAQGSWRSCNPFDTTNASAVDDTSPECEYQYLTRVFPEWTFEPQPAIRWLSQKHECEWVGVICDDFSRVVQLMVNGQGLSGELPEEFPLLSTLNHLDLSFNNLSGALPPAFPGQMKNIQGLHLHYNKFNGQLPSEYFAFEIGQLINLGSNRLTGTLSIPSNAFTEAHGIFLSDNFFSGTIPSELAIISGLKYFRSQGNILTGAIPSEIGMLTNLEEFWLQKNNLDGTIPTEIGAMTKLADFRIFANNISGEIPEEVYGLPAVNRIDLYNTNITGTISTLIGRLTTLKQLRVRSTNLYGNIPTEIGLLSELRSVWLHHSDFSGSVPGGLCQLRSDEMHLSELVTDCTVMQTSGLAAVSCPAGCCTECCDQETNVCVYMEEIN